MTDLVLTERRDDVFLISLNRPEKRNAMNPEMLIGLSRAYTEFQHDRALRVAVLHAQGDHFCGGI